MVFAIIILCDICPGLTHGLKFAANMGSSLLTCQHVI